jgi:hypothetical protein
MDLQPGTRYPNEGELAEALAEVRRVSVGDVAVEIEIVGGGSVVGLLDSVEDDYITLLDHGQEMTYPAFDVAAVTLLAEPPPDR